MGSFFCDVLSFNHEVAIFDTDIQKLRFTFNTQRFTTYEEIRNFEPELLINAVTVNTPSTLSKRCSPTCRRNALFPTLLR